MELKFLKWQKMLCGSLMRRVVLRAFMLVIALIVVSMLKMAHEVKIVEQIMSNVDQCTSDLGLNPNFKSVGFSEPVSGLGFPLYGASSEESEILTKALFKGLMDKNLLQSDARALCVGEGSASAVLALREFGFFNVFGVDKHPFFSLLKRRFMYELEFKDNTFDLVFSSDLDKVSIPSLLVLEMERVLRPGGIGAVLLGARKLYLDGPLSASTLKGSDIVHQCGIGSFNVVIFKKRLQNFASFERFQLPGTCPSVARNKPFTKYLEPLEDKNPRVQLSYLPDHMNISSRNKLVYINVGAGEYAKTSIAKMSTPYLSDHHSRFDVFIIDHKISVLTSYVTDPGVTFVYDPTLSGSVAAPVLSPDDYLDAPTDEEGFEFVWWFNEMVDDGNLVVLMMNAKMAELNILVELFRTGAICRVDELFLRCPDAHCNKTSCGDCKNLLESLRKSGVYAHKWLGD